jgi:hypothetical protein
VLEKARTAPRHARVVCENNADGCIKGNLFSEKNCEKQTFKLRKVSEFIMNIR